MRLIDADKLEIGKLAEFTDEYGDAVPVYGVTQDDIDNAPTVSTSQWVSVKDRLPDCKGEYLVAYHPCYWDNVKEETVVGYDSYRGGARWARNKYQRVTHWMPMPQLPEVTLCEND